METPGPAGRQVRAVGVPSRVRRQPRQGVGGGGWSSGRGPHPRVRAGGPL